MRLGRNGRSQTEQLGIPSATTAIKPMTDREFKLFQILIDGEAGIYLPETKKALLVGRLNRRLRELRLDSFEEYYRLVQREDEERVRMLDSVCTNETHFFREPQHFQFVEEKVFPAWRAAAASGARARHVRVWSAGCSTGEEPYSLAMILSENFPASSGWETQVLATDLSTRALDHARAATWPLKKSKEIPDSYLKRFMLKGVGSQEGKMRARAELGSLIEFHRVNLNSDPYPVRGLFDLIFCRNVLIYFSAESRARVVNRLLNSLSSTGYLFLGHSETLNCVTDRARSVGPTVYAPIITNHSGSKTEASARGSFLAGSISHG